MAAALVAAGCGASASPQALAADQQFLAAVHLGASDISTYRSDAQLILLGRATCDGFSTGVGYQQLADRLATSQGSSAIPSVDLGAVITAAVEVFCPRYQHLVG